MQLFDTLFFALMIPVSAILAERGRRSAMLWITGAIFLFGLILAPMFAGGTGGALGMMALGMSLMGLTYGPLGTVISELFPTPVRYSGSSLAFNFAGILGASLAPYIATWLATTLWPAVCRLLSFSFGGADLRGAADDPRDEGRRSGRGDDRGMSTATVDLRQLCFR